MGLFDRKTIISVSSVIYSMGDEPENIPDVVKAAVITSSLRHNSVPVAINKAFIEGMGVKIRRAFNYAEQSYYLGMPTGFPDGWQTKDDPVLDLLVKEYLERIYTGSTVEVLSTYVEVGNSYLVAVEDLIRTEYSYDFADEETTAATGDVDVGATLVLSGPFLSADHPGEIGYELDFTNPDTTTVHIDKWYDEDLFNGYEVLAQRAWMRFRLNGGLSKVYAYTKGGDDSRLNIFLRKLEADFRTTYPPIVLKRDNVYLNTNAFSGGDWKTSDEYVTSKAYGNRLGIDIDSIMANVKDNENDDEIDFVFVQPGVRLNSPNQCIKKYLYHYFRRLQLLFPPNKAAFDDWVATNDHDVTTTPTTPNKAKFPPAQSVRFKDPESTAASLNMALGWRYITYEEKTGTLTDEYEVECGPYVPLESFWLTVAGLAGQEMYERTLLYIRRRLTDTTYAELVICGLRHENYVYSGHTVQSGVYGAFHEEEEGTEDPNDDATGFIIPLDYEILAELTPRDRLQLGQECMHIVFNCYKKYKQKWYETGFFRFIFFAVSIFLIALSWGTLAPYVSAAYQGFMALFIGFGLPATLAAALAALVTITLVVTVIKGIQAIATAVGEWAAEHWGPEWGAVVQMFTVIALTWGIGWFIGAPLFAGTLADAVIQIGGYVLSTMATYTQYQYVELKDKQNSWETYAYGSSNPMEEVNKLLEDFNREWNTAQQAILPKPETMDEFLGRTLSTTDGLTNRLLLPINSMAELTLTPRL